VFDGNERINMNCLWEKVDYANVKEKLIYVKNQGSGIMISPILIVRDSRMCARKTCVSSALLT